MASEMRVRLSAALAAGLLPLPFQVALMMTMMVFGPPRPGTAAVPQQCCRQGGGKAGVAGDC